MSSKIKEASWKFVGLQKTVILNRYTGFLVDPKSPHMSKMQFGFVLIGRYSCHKTEGG
ncbi:hypothetical protein HanXRQr2_Chr12g0545941 [Helianthus annuus]|uniref:Uncharacterized protein n=1 Tax=Helianthus annuus TaxID=4232 RepID=A0A9K3HHB0_HELAN|nr:hypothetical protein HanXRQr2_Chr12g0545941 [Helianthus annuus]KAJ0863059.1 hypothetical protein HanPSC8_Chr12g0525551 [Helianthus annuus]